MHLPVIFNNAGSRGFFRPLLKPRFAIVLEDLNREFGEFRGIACAPDPTGARLAYGGPPVGARRQGLS